MKTTKNNLAIHDCRDEQLNPSDWMVMGTIYESDDDMDGTDVCEGFDDIESALSFVRNTLS